MTTTSTNDEAGTEPARRFERTGLQPGVELAGRYRVERLIGEGGMGDVYLATHLKIDKRVAVKVLAPEQMRKARTVDRFLQEAVAASRIRHPNVVDITDYGESDGCAFLVMEYLEGEDLSSLLKRDGAMGWARAKAITTQVLDALGAAHAAQIIHRDIKPHNIFVTPGDGVDLVKVIDFGIAKLREGTGEQLTRTGAIMGTAEYMSPEQGLGQELDGRSDLYSMGIILYRMLTGEVPFPGTNPMAVLFNHVHTEVPAPSVKNPEGGISPAIDALVLRALAKDREQRFADASAFADAMDGIDRAPAVPKKKGSRAWMIGAAAVAVLGLGGLAIAWSGGDSGETDPAGLAGTAEPGAAVAAASPGTAPVDAEDAVDESPVPSAEVEPPVVEPAVVPSGEDAEPEPVPEVVPPEVGAEEPTADDAAPADVPARRPVAEVTARMRRLGKKVSACGKKAGLFPGEKISVQVVISTNGRVSKTTIKGAHAKAGKDCIAAAIRRANFGPAKRSQSASHDYKI